MDSSTCAWWNAPVVFPFLSSDLRSACNIGELDYCVQVILALACPNFSSIHSNYLQFIFFLSSRQSFINSKTAPFIQPSFLLWLPKATMEEENNKLQDLFKNDPETFSKEPEEPVDGPSISSERPTQRKPSSQPDPFRRAKKHQLARNDSLLCYKEEKTQENTTEIGWANMPHISRRTPYCRSQNLWWKQSPKLSPLSSQI